jgi:hypothetical protein
MSRRSRSVSMGTNAAAGRCSAPRRRGSRRRYPVGALAAVTKPGAAVGRGSSPLPRHKEGRTWPSGTTGGQGEVQRFKSSTGHRCSLHPEAHRPPTRRQRATPPPGTHDRANRTRCRKRIRPRGGLANSIWRAASRLVPRVGKLDSHGVASSRGCWSSKSCLAYRTTSS